MSDIINNKLTVGIGNNVTRFPIPLMTGILLVCILPFVLTLLGVDFGTQSTAFDHSRALQETQNGVTVALFYALSGAFTYTLLQCSAFCVAAFVLILAFSHYKNTHDITIAIISIAFFMAGCMDALPVLAVERLIDATVDNGELIPFTSAISRLFSALIMIVAAIVLLRCKQQKNLKAGFACITCSSLILGLVIYSIIYISTTNTQLPQMVYPDAILTRPFDALPLLLFVFAGLVVYPQLYKRQPSLFAFALIISAIPAIMTQLHLTFGSTTLYDSHFNIGYFLKIIAYSIPLLGLILDNMRTHQLLQLEVREHKRTEAALREMRTHQGTVLETVADAIITIDKNSLIQSFNPAAERIFGYHQSEAIGQNVSMLLPTQLRKEHEHYTSNSRLYAPRVINKNRDLQGQRKDGSLFPLELNIAPMKTGENQGYVGILRDITQRKEAEKTLKKTTTQAKASNQAKSIFLASMSHEIRTPMNAVLGILGLLKESSLSSKQLRLVQTGRESGEMLLSIINNILDFSKMEADKLQLEHSSFDLHQLLTHSVNLLKLEAERKDLSLTLVIHPDLPRFAKGDPDRLLQIFINLTNNAIKFTTVGSICVTVSASNIHNDSFTLNCEVQDSGIGIAESLHKSLFDEFTMADHSYTRRYDGSGLGLAICKSLVSLMHGTIGVTSEPANGSTFFFDIQLQPSTEQDCNYNPILHEPQRLPAANTRILLAEDNPANQLVIKNILEYAYLQVDTVANGIEAVKAITNIPYDLVLMDISMPEMDGMTATREIRKLSGQAGKIPIIALTAHALKGDKECFLQSGMNDYLSKPIDRSSILHCIARWTGASPTTEKPETDHAEAQLSTVSANTEDPYVHEQVLQQLVYDTSPDIVLVLLVLYIKDAEYRTEHIQQAITNIDLKTLQSETHTLSSSAAAYGNEKLHRLALKIETYFHEGNHQQALILAATLPNVANESFLRLAQWTEKEFEAFKTGV